MSLENKPQIIIHKSNWAKQLIIAVVVLVFFFFAIGKNPSKSDFIQGCVKEYLKKEQSFGSSTSNYVSEVSTGIFGSWFEPLIERDDYVIFSKFYVDIDNDEFKMKIKAFGFWGNIIFTEGVMESKEQVQSEMEKAENREFIWVGKNNDGGDCIFKKISNNEWSESNNGENYYYYEVKNENEHYTLKDKNRKGVIILLTTDKVYYKDNSIADFQLLYFGKFR